MDTMNDGTISFHRLVVVFLVSFLIAGCAATKKHWQISQLKNTIEAYENFLRQHPESEFSDQAQLRLNHLYAQRDWEKAKGADTISAYESYLDEYSESVFSDSAEARLEHLRAADNWQRIKTSNTIAAFERFLKKHPHSAFSDDARSRMDRLILEKDWKDAQESDTIVKYETFLKKYPRSEFADEAQQCLQKLHRDLSVWEKAKSAKKIRSYRSFIANNPQNRYIDEAKILIADYEADIKGRNIIEALNQGKIEVKVTGSGIKSVNLKMKRLVDHLLKIFAPVGTYFVCHGSAQNMVSRTQKVVDLTNDEWLSVNIDAACANRSRNIPDSDESFDIQESPHQEDLKKLMPVLGKARVSFGVEQAAVWIVTDNADYSDLGTLVERSMFQIYGGTRVIKEYEAARAMRICDQAGIDITSKAIWKDRKKILEGLKDKGLSSWLLQKSE